MSTSVEAIEAVQRLAQSVLDHTNSDAHAAVYEDLETVEAILRLVTDSVLLVAAERHRQQTIEGYDSEHDHEHAPEMLDASASYAHYVSAADKFGVLLSVEEVECWPPEWGPNLFKPDTLRKTTIKSVALGLAALDDLLLRGVA